MNTTRISLKPLKVGLAMTLLVGLAGCVGYVDGGGGYGGGAVVVAGPEVGFYGGGVYERGVDVHSYSHRGVASRAAAHPGGGRGGKR